MKSNEPREIALVRVGFENVMALFEQKGISKRYQEVKNSEPVKKHYQDMIEELKRCCDSKMAQNVLEMEEVHESNEEIIKTILLNKAFDQLVAEGSGELTAAVTSAITEENFKKAIDEVKEVTAETINTFCDTLIGGVSMAVGIALLEEEE